MESQLEPQLACERWKRLGPLVSGGTYCSTVRARGVPLCPRAAPLISSHHCGGFSKRYKYMSYSLRGFEPPQPQTAKRWHKQAASSTLYALDFCGQMGCAASIDRGLLGRRKSSGKRGKNSTRTTHAQQAYGADDIVVTPPGSQREETPETVHVVGAGRQPLRIETKPQLGGPSRRDVGLAVTPVGKQADEYRFFCPVCMMFYRSILEVVDPASPLPSLTGAQPPPAHTVQVSARRLPPTAGIISPRADFWRFRSHPLCSSTVASSRSATSACPSTCRNAPPPRAA